MFGEHLTISAGVNDRAVSGNSGYKIKTTKDWTCQNLHNNKTKRQRIFNTRILIAKGSDCLQ